MTSSYVFVLLAMLWFEGFGNGHALRVPNVSGDWQLNYAKEWQPNVTEDLQEDMLDKQIKHNPGGLAGEYIKKAEDKIRHSVLYPEYQKLLEAKTSHETKFLLPGVTVGRAVRHANEVGLLGSNRSQKVPKLRILDIGSGAGWFIWFLREQGYDTFGLEPLSTWASEEKKLMSRLLETRTIDHLIKPFSPLPQPLENKKYDVITSWLTKWDHVPLKNDTKDHRIMPYRPYDADEWEFLLKDIGCKQLRPGGTFFLEQQVGSIGGRTFWDNKARLEKAGASVEKLFGWRTKSLYKVSHMEGLCKKHRAVANHAGAPAR
eukprot:gnl/TRDRNA2_/TRDRNA2_175878_c0_seq1.p1 gnl/TRDRNA2_/TRDRNA2_175878_c0~~gnl/TRDRNA2_/TRDRNA2_175878_c0_seq1.p1  ORF type:complete len:317 (-),score=26.68 gnl/TRDRNA2_/TRDRNA2_175878_c0_seq1:29-979(-)